MIPECSFASQIAVRENFAWLPRLTNPAPFELALQTRAGRRWTSVTRLPLRTRPSYRTGLPGDYVRYCLRNVIPLESLSFMRNAADRRVIQLTVNRDCCGALTPAIGLSQNLNFATNSIWREPTLVPLMRPT